MGMFDYIAAHPWWTLLYLLVIASAFNGFITITWKGERHAR